MTEKQGQGKWVWVQNSGEFELTEFELAGFNCMCIVFDFTIKARLAAVGLTWLLVVCENYYYYLPSKWKKWFLRIPRPIMNAAIPLGCLPSSCSGCRSLASDWRQVGHDVSFSNHDLRQELNNREPTLNVRNPWLVLLFKIVPLIIRHGILECEYAPKRVQIWDHTVLHSS